MPLKDRLVEAGCPVPRTLTQRTKRFSASLPFVRLNRHPELNKPPQSPTLYRNFLFHQLGGERKTPTIKVAPSVASKLPLHAERNLIPLLMRSCGIVCNDPIRFAIAQLYESTHRRAVNRISDDGARGS